MFLPMFLPKYSSISGGCPMFLPTFLPKYWSNFLPDFPSDILFGALLQCSSQSIGPTSFPKFHCNIPSNVPSGASLQCFSRCSFRIFLLTFLLEPRYNVPSDISSRLVTMKLPTPLPKLSSQRSFRSIGSTSFQVNLPDVSSDVPPAFLPELHYKRPSQSFIVNVPSEVLVKLPSDVPPDVPSSRASLQCFSRRSSRDNPSENTMKLHCNVPSNVSPEVLVRLPPEIIFSTLQ